jgi:hypothetical protein
MPFGLAAHLDAHLLLMCVGMGALPVAFVAAFFGNRSISPFWLYFALAFRLLSFAPLWYFEKSDEYLPLATPYLNGPNLQVVTLVLVPHVLVSLGIAALIHRKLVNTSESVGVDQTGGSEASGREAVDDTTA